MTDPAQARFDSRIACPDGCGSECKAPRKPLNLDDVVFCQRCDRKLEPCCGCRRWFPGDHLRWPEGAKSHPPGYCAECGNTTYFAPPPPSATLSYSAWSWLKNSLHDQCREHLDDAARLRKRHHGPVKAAALRLADLHEEAAALFAQAASKLEKEGHARE